MSDSGDNDGQHDERPGEPYKSEPTAVQFDSFKEFIDINDIERLPIKLLPNDPDGNPAA
jgi:hypothetical protein